MTVSLRRLALLATVAALPLRAQTVAQQGWNPQQILRTETFVKPPADVERMIVTPRTDITFTSPSPDRKWFLKAVAADRGDIDAYGKSHINLGGLQIDTKANRARTVTTSTRTGLTIVDPRTLATKTIETPKGATLWAQTWSPNGAQIAYIANFDDASHIFVADVATGKSVQITKTPLLATLVTGVEWTADGKSIVTVLVPDMRGAAPTHGKNGVEDGPEVRLTESRALPQVIHPALLEDPHDKALLTYYTTGQLAVIDVKSKVARKVGAPAMFRAVDASPDGQYFRVTRMVEPFSYIVPVTNFGGVQELWDANGKVVATLGRTPLAEGGRGGNGDPDAAPAGRGGQQTASDTGKRNVQWNPVGPGLVYMQSVFASAAPSGGRAAGRGQPAAQRPQPTSIRYMSWVAPFGPNDTKVLYEGSARLTSVAYSADGRTMFVADSGGVFAMRTGDVSKKCNLGAGVTLPGGGGFGGRGGGGGRGGFGAQSDTSGGALATRTGAHGEPVVIVGSDNKTVFLSGTRAPGANWNTQAPRPWVDKLDFETGQRARVFDSPADAYRGIRYRARRRLQRVHLHARVADGDRGRVPAHEGRREHAADAREGRWPRSVARAAQAHSGHAPARRHQVLDRPHAAAGLAAGHAAAGHHLVLSARVHVAGGVRSVEVYDEHQQVPRGAVGAAGVGDEVVGRAAATR